MIQRRPNGSRNVAIISITDPQLDVANPPIVHHPRLALDGR